MVHACSDLEKQSGALALRVDTERREAWIARERLSLLEVELINQWQLN